MRRMSNNIHKPKKNSENNMKKCFYKKKNLETKICVFCKKEFRTKYKNKDYCSKKCCSKMYYQNNKNKINQKNKDYRIIHQEERKAYDKKYNQTHKKQRKAYDDKRKKKIISKKPISKKCLNCEKEFNTKNSGRIFCSTKCCGAYYWRKIRMKGKIEICLYCKREFKKTHGRQKYCSTKCYWALYNQNHKQERKRYYDNSIQLVNKITCKCAFCDKEIYLPKRKIKKKNFCSIMCANRERAKEQMGGLWEEGKSFGQYGLAWTRKLRKTIRERDNYICQLCNKQKTQLKKDLFIHHIDYMKINNLPFNLISLCNSCHTLTNHKRKYFTKFFQNYLSDKYGYKYHHTTQGTMNKWTEITMRRRK